MNAKEMHYDFKQKLNKIDSQKARNLYVPEIDWKLNEAQDVFIKMIAQPRSGRSLVGFEINNRTINDIRTVVVDQTVAQAVVPTVFDDSSYIAALPGDYWFLASAKVYATKGPCIDKILNTKEAQHDDGHEDSPFDRSSFEWKIVNISYNEQGIRLFTDSTFTISKFRMEYIRHPRRISNAPDWEGGIYTGLDGVVYNTIINCELPLGTHSEIVDLTVLITAGDLSLPDYQIKEKKIGLTQ